MKTPRTSRQRKPVFEARFARLLEGELEKATLVLNAKAITDKLQKMAEDLAGVEANDIMPVLDAFKEAFGPEATEQFSSTATQAIRTLLDAVSSAKDGIGNEVLRLEKIANGEDTSDMAMDSATPAGEEMPPEGGEPAPGAEMDGPPAPEGDLPQDLGDDAGPAPGDDEDAMVGGTSAGRAKKESAVPRGRRLREFAEMHLSDNIEALRDFEPKAGILASQISSAISRAHLDDSSKRELSHALGHLAGVCINPAHFEDPDQKIENTLMHAHLDSRLPEVRAITSMLKKLSHMIAFKHEGVLDAEPEMHNMLEGVARNVRRLRESANPDAVVLASFRKGLSKGAPVREAATRTARSFAIDVSDVVSIVKEARQSARPFVAESAKSDAARGVLSPEKARALYTARLQQKSLTDAGIRSELVGHVLEFRRQEDMDKARDLLRQTPNSLPKMQLVTNAGRAGVREGEEADTKRERFALKLLAGKGIRGRLDGSTITLFSKDDFDKAKGIVRAGMFGQMPDLKLAGEGERRQPGEGTRRVAESESYVPMFPLGGSGSTGKDKAPQPQGQGKPVKQAVPAKPGKSAGRRVEVDEDDEAVDTGDGTSDAPAAPNTSGSATNSASTAQSGSTSGTQGSTNAPNAPKPPNAPQASGSMQPGTQQAGATPAAPNAPQPPKAAYAPKGPQQAPNGPQAPVSGAQPNATAGDDEDDAMAGQQQSGAKPGVAMPGKTLNRAPNAPR